LLQERGFLFALHTNEFGKLLVLAMAVLTIANAACFGFQMCQHLREFATGSLASHWCEKNPSAALKLPAM
jgi:hypothetical protein